MSSAPWKHTAHHLYEIIRNLYIQLSRISCGNFAYNIVQIILLMKECLG